MGQRGVATTESQPLLLKMRKAKQSTITFKEMREQHTTEKSIFVSFFDIWFSRNLS
jgi:hypothetical protein